MNSTVRVSSDLELRGTLAFGINAAGFPANPKLGTLFFKDGVLYGYQLIGGLETWYPLTNRTKSYVHTQGLAALQWTVNHALGSVDNWFQVQDDYGNPIMCSRTTVDANSFTLDFTEETTGRVIVVAPDSITVPSVQTSLLTATSVNIGGGSVLLSAGAGSINGSPILTEAALGSGAGVFATLVEGKVPASQLPSYVDDVLEVASLGALPIVGETGKIYVTTDNGKIFRWTGSVYVEISATAGTADAATKLATARTITLAGDLAGSVDFDGSANVTLTAAIQGDKVGTKTFNGPISCHYVNDGSYIVGNVTGATTLSLTGVPDSTKAYGMTFELTNAGANVTWPASVTWLGTAPTLRASGISVVTLVTRNGGTSWLGSAA